jgi:hypothetical protein
MDSHRHIALDSCTVDLTHRHPSNAFDAAHEQPRRAHGRKPRRFSYDQIQPAIVDRANGAIRAPLPNWREFAIVTSSAFWLKATEAAGLQAQSTTLMGHRAIRQQLAPDTRTYVIRPAPLGTIESGRDVRIEPDTGDH